MNLTFGICWIEDQASEAEVQAVEERVRASGFEPEIVRIESESDIREFARQQYHFHDYDLILLDFMLGEGLRGDALAPQVRRAFRSTPILFYSAQTENGLRKKMAEKLVEGVYCTHRDRLSERVGELVSDLSPALNRLSGMRGLAARVVAECDQEFRAILLHIGEALGNEAAIVSSLKALVLESSERQKTKIDPIRELVELLGHHAISSAMLFQEVYGRLNDPEASDEVRHTRRALRQYPETVLARRNVLSHALEKRTPNGWRIARPVPHSELTVQDFENFRAEFLSHLRDVRRLRSLLVGDEPE